MKDKKKHTGRKILFMAGIAVCLAVFLFSLYNIVIILKEYREAEKIYDGAVEEYTLSNDESAVDTTDDLPQIDFDSLLKINDDVIGWIYIEGTDVNYPVLKGSNNYEYLFQSYMKKYLTAGSIFIDYRCDESLEDLHTVIYGHNMKNGAMFGQLDKYKKESYLKEHPYVYIIKKDGSWNKYEIFSAYEADIDGKTYDLPMEDKEDYQQLIDLISEENILEKDIDLLTFGEKGKILTLSTCTEDSSNTSRFVVNCMLIDEKN